MIAARLSLCLALAVAALAAVAPSDAHTTAADRSAAACLTVHVGPRLEKGARASSYFRVVARPGQVVQLGMIVANPAPYPCSVTIEGAYGQTALNSGDTYPLAPPGRSCFHTSCWLSGLPLTVRVPPRSRVIAPFALRVSVGTRGGQYLAGVLARPAEAGPRPATPSGRGHVGVSIVTHVGIGVAIRVPGPLRPGLAITSVRVDMSSGAPLLDVVEQNLGNSWEHPRGGAQIRIGKNVRTYGIRSSTVLPGDSATLSLPIEGIEHGERPTAVVLWYDHHTRKAVWHGTLSFRSPAPGTPEATPTATPGSTPARVVVTSSRIPVWLVTLAAGLGGLLLVCLSGLVIILRRRRRDDAAGTP